MAPRAKRRVAAFAALGASRGALSPVQRTLDVTDSGSYEGQCQCVSPERGNRLRSACAAWPLDPGASGRTKSRELGARVTRRAASAHRPPATCHRAQGGRCATPSIQRQCSCRISWRSRSPRRRPSDQRAGRRSRHESQCLACGYGVRTAFAWAAAVRMVAAAKATRCSKIVTRGARQKAGANRDHSSSASAIPIAPRRLALLWRPTPSKA